MPVPLSKADARELAGVCKSVAETARRDMAKLPVGYENVVAGLRERAERFERLALVFAKHAEGE